MSSNEPRPPYMAESNPQSPLPWSQRRGLIGQIRRQWPWVTTVAVVALGLLLIALGWWRIGAILVGASLVGAGLGRKFLPNPGILVFRHQRFDVPFYLVLGLAIMVFAWLVPAA
jgi:hypothetical protein